MPPKQSNGRVAKVTKPKQKPKSRVQPSVRQALSDLDTQIKASGELTNEALQLLDFARLHQWRTDFDNSHDEKADEWQRRAYIEACNDPKKTEEKHYDGDDDSLDWYMREYQAPYQDGDKNVRKMFNGCSTPTERISHVFKPYLDMSLSELKKKGTEVKKQKGLFGVIEEDLDTTEMVTESARNVMAQEEEKMGSTFELRYDHFMTDLYRTGMVPGPNPLDKLREGEDLWPDFFVEDWRTRYKRTKRLTVADIIRRPTVEEV